MRSKYSGFWLRNLCVYFALMAAFYSSLVAVVTKLLSDSMNSFEIVFFRNVIGLGIVCYVLYKSKTFDLFKDKKHWFLLFMRGFLGVSGITCFFYNIAHTDLGTANVLFKTAPMFCALFAVILLKEKFSNRGWFGLILGFIGFCFIAQPQLGLKVTDIVGILGGILSGLALTSVRELKKYYSSNTIVFSSMITGTLMMCVVGILGNFDIIKNVKFIIPNAIDFVYIALIGIGSYLFQLYVTKSYVATKKTGIPAGISYSEVVFSLCFGLLLGDPIPNIYKFLGIVLIILSGVIVALERNRKCKVVKSKDNKGKEMQEVSSSCGQMREFRPFFKKYPMEKNDSSVDDFHCSKCGSKLNLVYSQIGKAYFSCANWEKCGEIFPAYCDISRKISPNYNSMNLKS